MQLPDGVLFENNSEVNWQPDTLKFVKLGYEHDTQTDRVLNCQQTTSSTE